jgi:hypothetical protein
MAPLESRSTRLALAIVGIAAAMTLAGCKSTTTASPSSSASSAPIASATPSSAPPVAVTPSSAPTSPPSTPPSAPAASATASDTPAPSGSPSAVSTPGPADVAAALAQWKLGAAADSADQGKFWIKAAGYLADAGATYATQIEQLAQLTTLPDAQQSAAQNKEYHADIKALNAFFKTPNLYS